MPPKKGKGAKAKKKGEPSGDGSALGDEVSVGPKGGKKDKGDEKKKKAEGDAAKRDAAKNGDAEKRRKDEEGKKDAAWQALVEKTLASLRVQVPLLDQALLGEVAAALDEVEAVPKKLILTGKLKIGDGGEGEGEKGRADRHKEAKAGYLKTLRSRVQAQRLAGNLMQKDYALKLKEIKELEQDADIPWADWAPPDLPVPSLQNASGANRKNQSPRPAQGSSGRPGPTANNALPVRLTAKHETGEKASVVQLLSPRNQAQ